MNDAIAKARIAAKLKSKTKKGQFSSSTFRHLYLGGSLIVIFSTTIYWSLLGARLQLGNSDQLVDPDLFKSLATLKGATFPGAHSLLIKWPIFWLINLFGSTNAAIEAFSVGLVVLSVGLLLTIIYKIEHRPIVFGTICLALASVLLLVPAAPYAGALLPVNMAMLTTRNIEYLVFLLGLILFIRSPKIRSLGFWLSAIILSLLFASDKLFLLFVGGGALLALVIYARGKGWAVVNTAVNLIILGIIAAIGSYLILGLISASGLAHFSSAASTSPYNLATTPKEFGLGLSYGLMAIFTNFGANPAFAATELKHTPSQIFDHLFSVAGPDYIINLAILLIGLLVVAKLVRTSWKDAKSRKKIPLDKSKMLAVLLIWISVAAFISFVVTNHYYAVDARYLTIVLFTVFIAFAAYSRSRKWRPEVLVSAGAIIFIGIIFGVIGTTKGYNADQAALSAQNSHNVTVAQALEGHHATLLVGDYWRVIPIKQIASSNITVTPLGSCTEPLPTLSSSLWQPNLHTTKFAYLLTIEGSLTNYPNCTLKQIISFYGKPNASTLIAGTLTNPQELLLFYDRGIHKSTVTNVLPTVLPISLSGLPDTSCSVPGVMNIVAHEDDDLLFMSPDLINYVKSGDCVRTVYVTAGNAGAGESYWLGREEGVEAAYSEMLGSSSIWIQRIVEIAPQEFISVANPKGNTKISLIFMHLPDGNLKGQGFSSTDFESLTKLEDHQISNIKSVDNQSYYSSKQLIVALSSLMNVYQPSQINTQSSVGGSKFPDHFDHLAVSWYVTQAYAQFETEKYDNQVVIPITYYEGYPIRQSPANVSGEELTEKEAAFLAYAMYDGGVCQTLQICLQTPTYNGYLSRQYVSSY